MNNRYSWLVVLLVVVCSTGCTNGRRGLGLFSNLSSARIAPPATGSLRIPQVANTTTPYANPANPGGVQNPSSMVGWRPSGIPLTANGVGAPLVPTSHRVAQVPNPQANLQVVTGTSAIRQANGNTNNRPPTRQANQLGTSPQSQTGAQPIYAGMPVNDASHLSAPGTRNQRNILHPTMEVVVQPQIQPVPQRYNPNAYAVAANPGYPTYPQNTYPVQNTGQSQIPSGWRQRNVNGNLAR